MEMRFQNVKNFSYMLKILHCPMFKYGILFYHHTYWCKQGLFEETWWIIPKSILWDTTGKSKNYKITKKPSPNWGKRGWWCGIQPGKLEEKSDRKSWGSMLNNTKIYFVRYNQE